jgi:hypothetical protein
MEEVRGGGTGANSTVRNCMIYPTARHGEGSSEDEVGGACDRCRGADKSLARPASRCILFDGENISFDVSIVIYINSTNNLPIKIINRIYETRNLLSL